MSERESEGRRVTECERVSERASELWWDLKKGKASDVRVCYVAGGGERETKCRERKKVVGRPKHFMLQHKYHSSSRLPFCSDHGLLVGIHFLPSPLNHEL